MPYLGRTPTAVPVTADDIPANSIDASKIADGTVDYADIARLTGDFTLGDGKKIKLGASDDLQIYHDGSNSYISDTGDGELRLETDGTTIRLRAGTDTLASFVKDGASNLRYDGATKLSTTNTGIDITGGVDIEASVGPVLDFSSTYGYGPNRDWRFIVNNFGNGNWGGFSLEKSTAQGGTPSVSVFGIDGAGNMGLGVGGPSGVAQPQAKLDVGGTIRTSTGILFGSDTSSSNTLDDYETGSFNPTFQDVTVTTYDQNEGLYTKVGNLVTVTGVVSATAWTANGNQMCINNLPFTIKNDNPPAYQAVSAFWEKGFNATPQPQALGLVNTARFCVYDYTAGNTNNSASYSYNQGSSSGGARIRFSFTYFTA